MFPSVKIHLHKRQQREEDPKKMSRKLAKLGSNLLTKTSPMNMGISTGTMRFCNGIPHDNTKIEEKDSTETDTKIEEKDSTKTDTKIEDKEKDSLITYTDLGNGWKRDSKGSLYHEICTSSGCKTYKVAKIP